MEPLAAWASRSGGFVIRQDRVLAFAMRYKNGGITNPFIRCERITNPLERPRTEAFSIGFSDRDPTPNPSPSRGGERKLGRGSHPLRGEGLGVGTVLLALHLPQEVLPFRGGFRRGFGGVRGGVSSLLGRAVEGGLL